MVVNSNKSNKIKYEDEIKYFIKKGENKFVTFLLKSIFLLSVLEIFTFHYLNLTLKESFILNLIFILVYFFTFILFLEKNECIIRYLIEKEIEQNFDLTFSQKKELKNCIKKHSSGKNIHILNIEKIIREMRKEAFLN